MVLCQTLHIMCPMLLASGAGAAPVPALCSTQCLTINASRVIAAWTTDHCTCFMNTIYTLYVGMTTQHAACASSDFEACGRA